LRALAHAYTSLLMLAPNSWTSEHGTSETAAGYAQKGVRLRTPRYSRRTEHSRLEALARTLRVSRPTRPGVLK